MPVAASASPTADPLSSRSATQHTHDHDSLSCLPCRRLDRFLCHAAGSTLSLRLGHLALIWGRRARRCLPCLAAGPCCDTLPLTPASPTSTLPPVGEPCARPLSTPYTLAYARYSSSLLSSSLLSFFGTNHSSPPPPISNHPSIAFAAPRDLSTDLALDCISLQSPHTSPNVHIREQEPRSTSSLHSSTLSPNSTPQTRTPVLRPTPDPSARPFL